jgi:hypothetical protein
MEMAVRSMETAETADRENYFPILAWCRNRDFCPPKFIGGGGGATELF